MNFPRIIQVEITTACQAGCSYCPRTLLKDKWVTQHLSREDFSSIMPAVRAGTLVHLQGWGEPLLHPGLWDMAAEVKRKKGRVSLTTNGMLMDELCSREIARLGFEFVAVSLAATGTEGHNMLRAGTDLDWVTGNIRYLSGLKDRPRIHIAVQMMKTNLESLPDMVVLAAEVGADRLIASNLDCLINSDLDQLKVFGEHPDANAEDIMTAARNRGRDLGIEVEVYPLQLQYSIPACAADPLQTVVLTVRGEIAPCVYLSLPVDGDVPRVFQGEAETTSRFVYGIAGEGFSKVMKGRKARAFLDAFNRRRRAAMLGTTRKLALLAMPRLRSTQGEFLKPASRLTSPSGDSDLPPAPEPCRHCYKLCGI
jgi:MoaA/NifB/PqqE/SkfB family radical SAM enzyme